MTRRRRRSSSFEPGRLIAGAAVSFGALALVLSLYNPISGASGPEESFFGEDLPDLQEHEQPQPSQLKAASAATSVPELEKPEKPAAVSPTPKPQPTTGPLPKQPPPLDALPASKVRSVGVNPGRSSSSTSALAPAPYTGPLSVALVPMESGAASLADRIATQLRAKGRDVKLTSLDAAGRPDVLLVLDASGSATQAWYCDPGPAGNAPLAKLLLAGVAQGDPGDGPIVDLDCAAVHAGRAQTAAVLLEVGSEPTGEDATATSISTAINRYLDENAVALRNARSRAALVWPASGPITSYFGPAHPLGIDVGQWEGDIVAAADGKVVFAGGDPCCSYGLYVVVESAGGVHTLYAHLTRIDVKTGQMVKQGQALGPVGCTGHCAGNHLHFEVFQNGRRIDPMLYLP